MNPHVPDEDAHAAASQTQSARHSRAPRCTIDVLLLSVFTVAVDSSVLVLRVQMLATIYGLNNAVMGGGMELALLGPSPGLPRRWLVTLVVLLLHVRPERGVQGYDCVFIADMHFKSDGPYPHAPSLHKEHCCDLCHETPGCVAGIFAKDPKGEEDTCWFKDAATVTKANEEKRVGNTACVSGEYATAAEKEEGVESDDGVGEWGKTFTKCVVGVSLAYVLGGIAYGRRTRSDGHSSLLLQWHPHWRQWEDLAALVQDGIAFSQARVRGRNKRLYREVARSAHASSGAGRAKADVEVCTPKREKLRQQKSGKKQNAEDSQEGSVRKSADGVTLSSNLAAASEPAASTPSGGGGRWVHVST